MSRATLKGHFQKNKIPTELHFAEWINEMIDQVDDGIQKVAENPLRIRAEIGPNAPGKPFLDIHEELTGVAKWRLSIAPPTVLGDISSPPADGFNIGINAAGSYLFINSANGNVGIGTTTPEATAKLTVNGNLRILGGTILQAPFIDADVDQPLQNGWAADASLNYQKPSYFKDTQGIVHLRGRLVINKGVNGLPDTVIDASTTIFQLRDGFHPEKHESFATAASGPDATTIGGGGGGGGGNAAERVEHERRNRGSASIEILQGGAVKYMAGGPFWISLDGISFRAK